MSAHTYTYAHTRTRAVVDQIDVLFAEAGINDSSREKISHGVEERWLDAVGLYLERDGDRVYEVEARINWSAHSDLAGVEFSSDLPGWENSGSPEAIILGSRFRGVAKEQGLSPRYWARFTSSIRANPGEHERLCPLVGVSYQGKVPDWAATPTTRSLSLQDLGEIGMSERSTL
jgi:hypothetical protein